MFMRTIVLQPWHSRVAGGYTHVALTLGNDSIDVRKVRCVEAVEAAGCFAVYEDRVFGIFLTRDGKNTQASLLVNDKIWQITNETRLSHQVFNTHRTFELRCGASFFEFDYQRLWSAMLRKPIQTILEVLAPDIWWEIVCDLPEWVAGNWKEGVLIEMLTMALESSVVTQ